MKQRKITRDDVYRTIEKPDETGLDTAPGRHHVRRKLPSEKFAIDVVYEFHVDAIRVITTYRVDLHAGKDTAPLIVRVRKKPPNAKHKQRKPKGRGGKKR